MKHTTSHSPAASSPQRLAGIERARRAALQDHAALPAGWIAPWVERSWQRCMNLGFEPHEPVTFDVVPVEQTRRTAEINQRLVQTARPVLEKLGRAIVNTRYFAILTNAEGVVVDVSGPIDRSDPRARNITRIGTDLSERSVGTTAIGTALSELQPVWLHRGEHFFNDTSVYSCAGAPLFGPDGACVGMLDLTGIDAVERPELKHLVTQSAGKIENALVLGQAHSLMMRLNWPGNALDSELDGIVCLDADGWISGANQMARQMVPDLATSGHPAVHVSEVFGVPYQLLFDAARHATRELEVPLWSGLRLNVQARLRQRAMSAAMPSPRPASDPAESPGPGLPLRDVEAALIRKAVKEARGNVAQAARALGISRATVYRKLGQKRP